jgi:hypothetical protein
MRAAAATNKVNPIFLLRGQRTPLATAVARAACHAMPAMQMLHAVAAVAAAAAFQFCLDAVLLHASMHFLA